MNDQSDFNPFPNDKFQTLSNSKLLQRKSDFNPFPNDKFQTFKFKAFAEDNIKFDENGRKFS